MTRPTDPRVPAPTPISVVICCHDILRWDSLCAAIDSIVPQLEAALALIVVVDHNPGLRERVARQYPAITVVENHSEKGLSGARNTGIKQSRGPLICFLDDDAVAEPTMISRFADRMRDERLMGVVAKIEPEWTSGAPRWFPDEFLWVVGCTYLGLKDGRVRNLLGAAMCVRRAVFAAAGGFSSKLGRNRSRLPLGCEETELCIRANAAHPGLWFAYDPAALCRHKVPAQRATWRYFVKRCFAEGLSKAHVADMLRSGETLETERGYVTNTLRRGALLGLRKFATRGDVFGLCNTVAIALGLFVTLFGFGLAKAQIAVNSRREHPPGAALELVGPAGDIAQEV